MKYRFLVAILFSSLLSVNAKAGEFFSFASCKGEGISFFYGMTGKPRSELHISETHQYGIFLEFATMDRKILAMEPDGQRNLELTWDDDLFSRGVVKIGSGWPMTKTTTYRFECY